MAQRVNERSLDAASSLDRRNKSQYQDRSLDRASLRANRTERGIDVGGVYPPSSSPRNSQRRTERSIDVGFRDGPSPSPLRHSAMVHACYVATPQSMQGM